MADDATKKSEHLKLVPEESEQKPMTPEELEKKKLDEEEAEFRAMRRDVPGVKGASEAGVLTISVGKQPTPKNTYYRTHKTFYPVIAMVNIEVGMDKHFIAVMPNMIEPLAGMGILTADHTLYLTITPEGGVRVIPVRGANSEGEQNEWDRTKELALIQARDDWFRMYSDLANRAFKNFPAPKGRFGEPNWPELRESKIMRLAFRDKGRLIDSPDHILVRKWAGRDR